MMKLRDSDDSAAPLHESPGGTRRTSAMTRRLSAAHRELPAIQHDLATRAIEDLGRNRPGDAAGQKNR
jgi:hypothetical protein